MQSYRQPPLQLISYAAPFVITNNQFLWSFKALAHIGGPYSSIEWTTATSTAFLELVALPIFGISLVSLAILSSTFSATFIICSLKLSAVSKEIPKYFMLYFALVFRVYSKIQAGNSLHIGQW